MTNDMSDFGNWSEFARDMFRYAANNPSFPDDSAFYEIIITKSNSRISMLDSEADLYFVRWWRGTLDERNHLKRQRLISGTVKHCVAFATEEAKILGLGKD